MSKKNLNLFKSFCFLGSFVAVSVIGSSAYAGPQRLIQTKGGPVVAVFEREGSYSRQSYAIGCQAVRKLWSGLRVEAMSSSRFNGIIKRYPVVANIPCNGKASYFTPPSGPAALVIRHKGGYLYRHYVNSPAWFTATKPCCKFSPYSRGGPVTSYRGPDFRTILKR